MARKKHSAPEKPGFNANRLIVCLAVFTTICAAACAIPVIRQRAAWSESQRELEALPKLPDTPRLVWSDLKMYSEKMVGINPDYVGVLRIENTTVSYPVVRGSDNSKYLNTSFLGSENPFGGLFMDYRCVNDHLPHIIIYGHHAQDTSGNRRFFGGLDVFLDEEYRAEHSEVVFMGVDHYSVYEIYSARVTDIDDPAYQLDFSAPDAFDKFITRNGAPPDAGQILTLSTCYGDGTDDRRIIVQGVRKSVTPVGEHQIMIAVYK